MRSTQRSAETHASDSRAADSTTLTDRGLAAARATRAEFQPVDPDVLAELRATLEDDDADAFVASLISDFCHRSPSFVAQMRDAVRCGDKQRWVLAAHTLKGQSGIVGAQRVRSLCQTLEDVAWPPDPTDAEHALAQLEEELLDAGSTLAASGS